MKKYMIMLVAVASAMMAQAALVHHWAFDGDTTDSAGSNDATLNGSTVALNTDGVRSYVSISDAGGARSYVSTGVTYDPDSDYTWAVWARVANDANLDGIIAGNRRDDTGTDFVPREFIKIQAANTVFRPNNVANTVEYADLSVAGGWTHITIVKSGTSVTPYINGVAGTGITLSDPFTESAMPFFIGGDKSASGANETFTGDIDDVKIFDNALSGTQVAALIPEPATIGLLAAFGGGVMFIRRRFMM